MGSLTKYIRRSLTAKLSIWIVLFALLVFSVSLGYMFVRSLDTVRQEAFGRASQVLNNTVMHVGNILEKVETATDNTYWLVMRHLDEPDSMMVYGRHIVGMNPFLKGCSISFEPYYYKQKGRYYSVFTYYHEGKIRTVLEGSERYDYFQMDWYRLAKRADKSCWTEPYLDYDPDNPAAKEALVSYCKPMKDPKGQYVGTISADLPLGWFTKTTMSVKPYPHSYCVMIGRGGAEVWGHGGARTLEKPDTALAAVGRAMQRGEEGMRMLNIKGENCYVFYKPVAATGWGMALVCPESDILGRYNRLERVAIGCVLLGIVLLMLVFTRIISKQIKPLRELAQQTDIIAKGDFTRTLPATKRIDEIGLLSQSFGNMQQALVGYIGELQHATAKKAAIENELRLARDIQTGMVPRVAEPFVGHEDIDLYASMTPGREAGSDLYSYVLRGDWLYICVGDVSGKGVPASLMMVQAIRLFRILAGGGYSPEDIAKRMNKSLCEGNDEVMYVTMFIGMFSLRTGHLDFCNCGHTPPLLDGRMIEIKYRNRPLGMFEGDDFRGESISDIRNRQLLVYTDGLNGAMDGDRQQFGFGRLQQVASESTHSSSHDLVEALLTAVESHRKGTPPNDDLTLLGLRVKR